MSIKKENVKDILGLTSIQEGMLFSSLNMPESRLYYEQIVFELKGKIVEEALKFSWNCCFKKYDSLRTVILWEGLKKPVQVILNEHSAFIEQWDYSDKEDEKKEELIREKIIDISNEVIDLRRHPFKIYFIKKDNNTYQMVLKFHHIIMDGWSLGIILKTLMNIYKDYIDDKVSDIIPDHSFKHYFEWLKEQDKNNVSKYWMEYLRDYNPISYLPYDNNANKEMNHKTLKVQLDGKMVKEIEKYTSKNQITFSVFCYTLWACILHKVSGEKDILFGRVVSGRPPEINRIEESVGMFVNTIPLRININGDDNIIKLYDRVKTICTDQVAFESTSSAEIKSYVKNNKGLLYDHVVVIENYPIDKSVISNFDITLSVKDVMEKTDYAFVLQIEPFNGIDIKMTYNASNFDESTINTLMEEYVRLISKVLSYSQGTIKDFNILAYHDDHDKYPKLKRNINYRHIFQEEIKDISLAQYLNQCFMRYSENTAICNGANKISYGQLQERANTIAYAIRKQDVGTKSRSVALLFEHDEDMILGMTAAIMSGAMFVALDQMYPQKRLLYIMEDAEVDAIICNSKTAEYADILAKNHNKRINIIVIDRLTEVNNIVEYKTTADDVALLIYTSGSTGHPKGVAQTNKNLLFHISSYVNSLKINENDRVALFTTYSHAVAIIDIISTLFAGGTILPYNIKTEVDRREVFSWLESQQITIYHSVPTLYKYIFQKLEDTDVLNHVRLVVLGGESVDRQDYQLFCQHFKKDSVFVNFFGCSEVMTASFSYFDHYSEMPQTLVPIGKFIDGVDVQLLNQNGEEVKLLGVGEIIYSSHYISKYWNEQDNDKYEKGQDGIIIYRSGDLGKRHPDGNVTYSGRKDSQVKINGHRIEISEIEETLNLYKGIERSIVMYQHSGNGYQMIAYYTVNPEENVNKESIISYMKNTLPEFMVPKYYIEIQEIPLTVNGKIDRNKLPKIEIDSPSEIHVADDIVMGLINIWKEVLSVDQVDFNDNFFALGGHSLKIFEMISAIRKEFDVDLSIDQIYNMENLGTTAMLIQESIALEKNNMSYPKLLHTASKAYFPLSAAQKRIYYHSKSSAEKTAYNESVALQIEGEIDLDHLQKAINRLVERYEILRTGFHVHDGTVVQKVEKQVEVNLELIQVNDDFVEQAIMNFIRPFDLETPPLLRVGLIQTDEKKQIFLFDIHHIITDATTMSILTYDLVALYSGLSLPSPSFQYRDYVEWQNQLFSSDLMVQKETYWIEKFKNEIPIVELPNFKNIEMELGDTNTVHFKINKEITNRLYDVAEQNNSTLFMVLLTAYFSLLYRYCNQEKLIVGVPVANRNLKEFSNMPGVFINMLPVISNITSDMSLKELLHNVKETLLEDYKNQDYPYDMIIKQLSQLRDLEQSNIFQTIFDYQNIDFELPKLNGEKVTRYPINYCGVEYGVVFKGYEEDNIIHFTVSYDRTLYRRDFIYELGRAYGRITKQLCSNLEAIISDIDILSDEERNKLSFFNQTEKDYSDKHDVLTMFKHALHNNPNKLAVKDDNTELTYVEFDKKSDQIAAMLLKMGVKKDSIIGLYMSNSVELMVCIWGVYKAGGAIMSIDPHTPKERIINMMQSATIKIIFADIKVEDEIRNIATVIDTTKNSDIWKTNIESPAIIKREDDSLTYVISTSGSTGHPKIVAIEESGLRNNMFFSIEKFNINENDIAALGSSIAFDISQLIFFAPLMTGASIILFDEVDEKKKMKKIAENCTITILTPTHITFMLGNQLHQPRLKKLLAAGEILTVDLCKKVRKMIGDDVEIYNLYGPTEATIYCSHYKYNPNIYTGETVRIGKGINNVKLNVVNINGRLQPIGVYGELIISGEGLARGYLNQDDLTAEKFIYDQQETRIYKTGDVVRWMPDGNIDFLERLDTQVNIRGYRIELNEVKSVLDQCDAVDNSVVVDCVDEQDEKFLCAYIIVNRDVTLAELKKSISNKLPKYMIPSVFVRLDTMPTTISGKVNKKELPEPITNIPIGDLYKPAENLLEEYCISIWRKILNLEYIGIDDDFFVLGGNSLKAMSFIGMLENQHGYRLDLSDIYQYPCIKALVKVIRKSERNRIVPMVKAEELKEYPLSAAQKRMYLSNLVKSIENSDNNTASAFLIRGPLDEERINRVFQTIVNRHEILRTSFEMRGDEPVQVVHENVQFNLICKTINENDLDNEIQRFIRPFDLKEAPLFRVLMLKMSDDFYACCIDAHHIVFDGYSSKILLDEVLQLYQGDTLPELTFQYKDYAVWQQKYMHSQEMQKQKEYWKDIFTTPLDRKDLFIDFERPAVVSFAGDSVSMSFGTYVTAGLKQIALQQKVSVFAVIMSIYSLLLSIYNETNDIVIGTPVFGRQYPELDEMIGMFVNTVPIRIHIDPELTLSDFIQDVSVKVLSGFENQDYQFDTLVKDLEFKPEPGRNPLFDTMISFQNTGAILQGNDEITIEKYDIENRVSSLDIVFHVIDGSCFEGRMTYAVQLFKRSTIDELLKSYVSLAENVINNIDMKVKDIHIFNDATNGEYIDLNQDLYIDFEL